MNGVNLRVPTRWGSYDTYRPTFRSTKRDDGDTLSRLKEGEEGKKREEGGAGQGEDMEEKERDAGEDGQAEGEEPRGDHNENERQGREGDGEGLKVRKGVDPVCTVYEFKFFRGEI